MNLQKKNQIIERYVSGQESLLIEAYILDGPSELRSKLGVSEGDFQIIFDYLVFEHNLLYKCVTHSCDFFLENYIKHGVAHLREILDVTEKKYDLIWEVVFDFLAISREGLYYHFLEHKDRYVVIFKARGADFLRRTLGITKGKYNEHWAKILDTILGAFCQELFTEQSFEHGLRVFSALINGMRVHRPVAKYEIFRRDFV